MTALPPLLREADLLDLLPAVAEAVANTGGPVKNAKGIRENSFLSDETRTNAQFTHIQGRENDQPLFASDYLKQYLKDVLNLFVTFGWCEKTPDGYVMTANGEGVIALAANDRAAALTWLSGELAGTAAAPPADEVPAPSSRPAPTDRSYKERVSPFGSKRPVAPITAISDAIGTEPVSDEHASSKSTGDPAAAAQSPDQPTASAPRSSSSAFSGAGKPAIPAPDDRPPTARSPIAPSAPSERRGPRAGGSPPSTDPRSAILPAASTSGGQRGAAVPIDSADSVRSVPKPADAPAGEPGQRQRGSVDLSPKGPRAQAATAVTGSTPPTAEPLISVPLPDGRTIMLEERVYTDLVNELGAAGALDFLIDRYSGTHTPTKE